MPLFVLWNLRTVSWDIGCRWQVFSFLIRRIYWNQFECNYLRNKTLFLNFLLHFWNLCQIFYFLFYGFWKTWLDEYLKSPISEHPSAVNMLKCAKHCWNLYISTFIIYFYHSEGDWIWKYLFVISKISGLFLNTLTANDKYFLHNRENLLQTIQIQLSNKETIFLYFFLHFWSLHQILNILK